MDKQCREYALKKMQEKKQKIGASQKLAGYAAGGAAKVRKGEATPSGKQVKTSPQKGRE
jgi:hypothetical protein